MHTEMWEHPATVANVATLRARGVHVIEPASGRLTGADTGPGRLPEPDEIARVALAVVEDASRATAADAGAEPGHGLGSGPAQDLAGRCGGVGGRDARAHRPGAVHRQPVERAPGRRAARAAAARGAHVTLVAANLRPGRGRARARARGGARRRGGGRDDGAAARRGAVGGGRGASWSSGRRSRTSARPTRPTRRSRRCRPGARARSRSWRTRTCSPSSPATGCARARWWSASRRRPVTRTGPCSTTAGPRRGARARTCSWSTPWARGAGSRSTRTA